MASLSYTVVDVFAESLYGGNPLTVISDGEDCSTKDLSAADMQKIAREFSLSETVFILPPDDDKNDCKLRIFSIERELPFAGHPTIGGAFIQARIENKGSELVTVEEPIGPVPVEITWNEDGPVSGKLTAIDGPKLFDEPIPRRVAAGILDLDDSQIHGDAWIVSCGLAFPLVELRDMEALASASFNYNYWLQKGKQENLGTIYCYTGDAKPGTELRARLFSPELGIREDPATGSAAVSLAGLLAIRNGEDGFHQWRVHQGIEIGRASVLDIEAELVNGEVKAARVGGKVLVVAEGTIKPPPSRNHLAPAAS